MSDIKELMTSFGYDKLISELKNLKTVQRPEIVEEIDIARSHGDLKENAEYHAAKEKQAFIDSRIRDLSSMVAKAKIMDPSTLDHTRVCFGSTVKLLNLETNKEIIYTISGSAESDPEKNIIYYNTPIARELLNKPKDSEIEITLPIGITEFQILDIYFKQ